MVGSVTAAVSAVAVAAALGGSRVTQLSLAPKSVTTPIAMGIAERVGGLPSLTAVLVIMTGILGAIGARYVYRLLAVEDEAVRGFGHVKLRSIATYKAQRDILKGLLKIS